MTGLPSLADVIIPISGVALAIVAAIAVNIADRKSNRPNGKAVKKTSEKPSYRVNPAAAVSTGARTDRFNAPVGATCAHQINPHNVLPH